MWIFKLRKQIFFTRVGRTATWFLREPHFKISVLAWDALLYGFYSIFSIKINKFIFLSFLILKDFKSGYLLNMHSVVEHQTRCMETQKQWQEKLILTTVNRVEWKLVGHPLPSLIRGCFANEERGVLKRSVS